MRSHCPSNLLNSVQKRDVNFASLSETIDSGKPCSLTISLTYISMISFAVASVHVGMRWTIFVIRQITTRIYVIVSLYFRVLAREIHPYALPRLGRDRHHMEPTGWFLMSAFTCLTLSARYAEILNVLSNTGPPEPPLDIS